MKKNFFATSLSATALWAVPLLVHADAAKPIASTCYINADAGVGLVSCIDDQGRAMPSQPVNVVTEAGQPAGVDITVGGVAAPEDVYGAYQISAKGKSDAEIASRATSDDANERVIEITPKIGTDIEATAVFVTPVGEEQSVVKTADETDAINASAEDPNLMTVSILRGGGGGFHGGGGGFHGGGGGFHGGGGFAGGGGFRGGIGSGRVFRGGGGIYRGGRVYNGGYGNRYGGYNYGGVGYWPYYDNSYDYDYDNGVWPYTYGTVDVPIVGRLHEHHRCVVHRRHVHYRRGVVFCHRRW